MNNLIKVNPAEFGLVESQSEHMVTALTPVSDMLQVLQKAYDNIIDLPLTPENCEKFKELSKRYGKTRTLGDKIIKDEKAFYWSAGKFCDALRNKTHEIIKPIETLLDEKANHFIVLEREAKAERQAERLSILTKIDPDGNYQYEALADMTDDVWDNYIAGVEAKVSKAKADAKLLEEARLIKEEAEAKASVERELEARRLRDENAKAQAEANEARAEADKAKAETKRLEQIEADRLLAIAEAEAKAKQDAEKLLKGSDAYKLKNFFARLSEIALPELTSPKGIEATGKIEQVLQKMFTYIKQTIKEIE